MRALTSVRVSVSFDTDHTLEIRHRPSIHLAINSHRADPSLRLLVAIAVSTNRSPWPCDQNRTMKVQHTMQGLAGVPKEMAMSVQNHRNPRIAQRKSTSSASSFSGCSNRIPRASARRDRICAQLLPPPLPTIWLRDDRHHLTRAARLLTENRNYGRQDRIRSK